VGEAGGEKEEELFHNRPKGRYVINFWPAWLPLEREGEEGKSGRKEGKVDLSSERDPTERIKLPGLAMLKEVPGRDVQAQGQARTV